MTWLYAAIALFALAFVALTFPDAVRRHRAHQQAIRMTRLIGAFAMAMQKVTAVGEESGKQLEVMGSVFQDLYVAMEADQHVAR